MKRVYHSVFAAVVKSLTFLPDCVVANREIRSVLLPGRATVRRYVARTLCLALFVSLLAIASPSARQTIAGLARESQLRLASWMTPNNVATKMFRSVADSYGRYENRLTAHTAGTLPKPGSSASAPYPAGHAAKTGSIPVVPTLIPPPPDAPPVFTDDPLGGGVTFVQALHITELRDAVNQVRARSGLAAASWELPVAPGLPIRAAHILELRARLDDARTALRLPPASYSPPAPSVGGSIRAAHVQEIREYIKAMLGTTSSADSALARLDPANQTGGGGENPLSRNYNWSISLLDLPGRSGLDLGLWLSYNSLVWTKRGSSSISFNDDGGFPSPGFRLGFPVIQPLYYNSEVGKYAFLLITPDGGHVELRQVNASALYEAADSSHLLLDTATMVLRTTDGTQLSYAWMGSDYQCTQIKDRNGNFITINYTNFGRIDTVADTLERTIKFNYTDGLLTSITQAWAGEPLHPWATFAYSDLNVQTTFPNLTVLGPANGSTLKVLTRVTLTDNSHYDFAYTIWGQIWKVSNFAADNHLLNYRSYNLPGSDLLATSSQDDCPRFTERHDWAENFNRNGGLGPALLPTGPEQEVVTAYAVPVVDSWTMPDGSSQTGRRAQMTMPDGTSNRIYFIGTAGTSSGWQRGLPALMNTYDSPTASVPQRQAVTTWTQDNTAASYPLNPRVTETNIYDPAGNRARTRVTYQSASLADGTSCQLPQDVYEYQANASTVLRRSHTDYNLATTYTDRRIIGLPSEKSIYEGDPGIQPEILMSKIGFAYDEAGSIQGTDAPVQHDNTNYSASLVAGRGNLTSVNRYDVSNTSQFTASSAKYNTAGAVVASIDPLGHQVSISYADSFSDNNDSRNTLAFPTSVTDPDNFSSTAQYNFDFGRVTRTQSPPPAGQTAGAIKNFIYDALGRIQKVAIEFNGNADYSHTRFEYPTSQNRLDTYSTIQEGLGEAHSFKIVDGHGRTIASASDHPGSTGGFSGQLVLYNNVGSAIKSSNPTETYAVGAPSQWVAAGDDAQAAWLYTQQSYDWKGRPLVTTNTDGTTKEASYGGCGCAGGEIVTLTDEGTIDGGVAKRQQQRIYADVLGRPVKTEVLNWQGGSVYTTTVNTYNARDQVTLVRQYQGPESSATYQDRTTTYDGFGRLKTKHVPEQDAGTATTYNYNSDDTVYSITDARGVSTTFAYNARRLVTSLSYPNAQDLPAGVQPSSNVSFNYDAAGNRTSMTDGLGSVSYAYDQLSRMTSETRTFNGVGTFPLNYDYNLAGELKTLTDPWGAAISYEFDSIGRLNNITGSGYGSVSQFLSNMQYRAWGTLKSETYGNGFTGNASYNGRLQMIGFEVRRPNNQPAMSHTNQFYANGQLQFSHDAVDDRFDRAASHDHAGRVIEAYSGSEARDFINATNSGAPTGSYRQSYQYNSFDRITQQTNRIWSMTETVTSMFTNNRRDGWSYDAAGKVLLAEGTQYTRDAAGRIIAEAAESTTRANKFDGDGRLIWTSLTRPRFRGTFTQVTYYLESSVLRGLAVAEIASNGQKTKGYVYAAGRKVAQVAGSYVSWSHEDPITGSRGDTTPEGYYTPKSEYNADGVDTGFEDPALFEPGGTEVPEPVFLGGNFGIGSSCSNADPNCVSCYLDGFEQDCGHVSQLMEMGAAVQCPNNDCGPAPIYDNWLHEYVGLAHWDPNAQDAGLGIGGANGWLPMGINFVGGSTVLTGWGSSNLVQAVYGVTFESDNPWNDDDVHPKLNHAAHGAYLDVGTIMKAAYDCIQELWKGSVQLTSLKRSAKGKDGKASFTVFTDGGAGIQEHATVTNNVRRYSAMDLGALDRDTNGTPFAPIQPMNGMTLTGNFKYELEGVVLHFSPYENYTASNREKAGAYFQGLQNLIGGFAYTQIHELGNSIAMISGIDVGKINDPSGDTDSGQQMSKCVAGKLSGGH